MKYPIFLFILISSLNCKAQHPSLLDCAVRTDGEVATKNIGIYIYSDPRCGFCQKAIKDIGDWSEGKPINLIAMDLSGKPESVMQLDLYRKYNIEVRDASQCNEKVKKFIPKIYIVETKTDKQVMKLRGWHTRDLNKLNRKLKKYI